MVMAAAWSALRQLHVHPAIALAAMAESPWWCQLPCLCRQPQLTSHQLRRVMEQSPAFFAGGQDLAKSIEEGIRFCKQKYHILQCPPTPASGHHRSVLMGKDGCLLDTDAFPDSLAFAWCIALNCCGAEHRRLTPRDAVVRCCRGNQRCGLCAARKLHQDGQGNMTSNQEQAGIRATELDAAAAAKAQQERVQEHAAGLQWDPLGFRQVIL